jgi:hypothetical protein
MPDKNPERSLHIPPSSELSRWFCSNGLQFVTLTFSGLAIINILTNVIGTQRIYSAFNSHTFTAFLSFVIYDSPGTVAGLFGVVVIFVVLSLFYFLLTGEGCRNRAFSFVITAMVTGVASQIVWNSCCNEGGGFPAGSSAIDFAALACLIIYSITDSIRLLRLKADRKSRLWMDSKLTALYLLLVAGMLMLYAVYVQPIYLPTIRFNWRVHEYAFLSAFIVSFLLETVKSTRVHKA